MSVESAKAKLDAQPGDPATGYISKADHQDSYTELVDDTALTGATTAEALTISGTLNGRDPDNLVAGPASATDNALVRFDGTGGKTVQGSGITVDDSNNISGLGTVAGTGLAGSLLSSASPVMNGTASAGTGVVPSRQDHVHPSDTSRAALSGASFTGDVTLSKASPAFTIAASAGNADFIWKAPAGAATRMYLQTASSARWLLQKDSSSESGSNAGSNLVVSSFTDGGEALRDDLTINRASGRWRVGAAGASAGIELGTSGPRIMSGTGSPEGVVTAPVGSIWTDTAATVGILRWRKASGTGNTGWAVAEMDSGNRNVTADLTAGQGWSAVTAMNVTRVDNQVNLLVNNVTRAGAGSGDFTVYTLPAGFRPRFVQYARTAVNKMAYVLADGTVAIRDPGTAADDVSFSFATVPTTAPASLPGS